MAELYPTFNVASAIDETNSQSDGYKSSVSFDFKNGDFNADSSGKMESATGTEAWKQWCMKTCLTQANAFLAYSSHVGIEMEESMAAEADRQTLLLEKTITEALLADPSGRTTLVQNFAFSKVEDGLFVSFDVSGIDSQKANIEITL